MGYVLPPRPPSSPLSLDKFDRTGWMATVWIYPAEILPLKIRAKGAALAAAADFLGNFLVSSPAALPLFSSLLFPPVSTDLSFRLYSYPNQVVEITPPALANIGYRTYIIFAVLNIANAIIVWCFYPETAGQTLESIDRLFTKEDDGWLGNGRDRWYRRLQWDMVGRAARAGELRRRTEGQRRVPIMESPMLREDDDGDVEGERVERVDERS